MEKEFAAIIPDFATNCGSYISGLPPSVGWSGKASGAAPPPTACCCAAAGSAQAASAKSAAVQYRITSHLRQSPNELNLCGARGKDFTSSRADSYGL